MTKIKKERRLVIVSHPLSPVLSDCFFDDGDFDFIQGDG